MTDDWILLLIGHCAGVWTAVAVYAIAAIRRTRFTCRCGEIVKAARGVLALESRFGDDDSDDPECGEWASAIGALSRAVEKESER